MAIGLVGLGVMGRNLALNWRDSGIDVVATDAWDTARAWRADGITVVQDNPALVAALPAPRVILLMVKAGEQVDIEIARLAPHLAPGDMILDGGNSHFRDTERRVAGLSEQGIGFLGVGISGGAEGARHGAALMVGGSEADWQTARPMLAAVAATAHDGTLCVNRFGEGGAGHFVKMVHNGIEYAIMQAIAEAHLLLVRGALLRPEKVAAVFSDWNETGKASGFLLEISAEIAATRDAESGEPLVDLIRDIAGQKGTGGWTVDAGIAHGVAIPSIIEAVTARQISAEADARRVMAAIPEMSVRGEVSPLLIGHIEKALIGTMTAALCQGIHLYAVAARAHGWSTDLPAVLRVWRAGSILRMGLLDDLALAIEAHDAPVTMPLAIPTIANGLVEHVSEWRNTIAQAVGAGYPVPVLASSLAYAEMLATPILPTAMVQAQRDRFGAHGFARTDREGQHHGPWVRPDADDAT